MAIEESSNVIRKWFADHDWQFDERKLDDGPILFTMGVAADPPIFKGYDICIVCRERDVQTTFSLPVKATSKRYAPVAEYLMRVNDRFRRGKWTLDYADGEICFSIVKDSEAVESDTDGAMDDLIGFAECVCDGFAEGVVQVIAGAKTPAQAYEEAVAREDADANNGNEGDACNVASKSPENGVTPAKAKRRNGKKRNGSAKASPLAARHQHTNGVTKDKTRRKGN